MSDSLERRAFLGATAGFTILSPELVRGTQRNSAIRMGLLGCGGRGTGVASGFLADTTAEYVALADLFQEQTERAQKVLGAAADKARKKRVPSTGLLSGPGCLDKLLSSKEVDVVHIATPPYFHPAHFEAVVNAGKHVYLEKPVGVDVPGVRRVLKAGDRAGNRLSVAVGFQLRHATPYVRLVERIKAGDIGQIVCGLSHYYAGSIPGRDFPNTSPKERRLRNWIHDRVISGDIIVEQNIHLIDVNNWVLGALPVSAQGAGGRAGRKDQGDCYSHFNVTYTYPNDVHVTLASTQFIEGEWDVAMHWFGTGGNAEMHYDAPVRITGPKKWDFPIGSAKAAVSDKAALAGSFKGALDDADKMKQRHFIDSITSGKHINQTRQASDSTLTAILGRQAAYAKSSLTFAEILKSDEVWDAKLDIAAL